MRSLKLLNDDELLQSTQALVQRERECTTQILRHLQEIERRKLYSDLRCASLFEYAVKVLGYSEASAGRRIAAMRLLTEIPEVAAKLESGALNLAKLCQAQSYFRSVRRQAEPAQALNTEQKKEVLIKLEAKTTRQAEKILLEMGGAKILPREQMKVVSAHHTEVRFLINEELREKLAEVRSLLGPKGGHWGLAELMLEMATLAAEKLAEKKFGKRRAQAHHEAPLQTQPLLQALPVAHPQPPPHGLRPGGEPRTAAQVTPMPSGEAMKAQATALGKTTNARLTPAATPHYSGAESKSQRTTASSAARSNSPDHSQVDGDPPDSPPPARRTRYVSQATQHAVWQAAAGRCTHCGSQQNLQFDHVEPFALGGSSSAENLRLLCRSCNLRRGVKTYGASALRR
jgi:hypothetical protein